MIFGLRAVIEAILAGKDVDKILLAKDLSGDLVKQLFASLKGKVIPVHSVPMERINRITRKNHQGVVAFLSPITYERIENIIPTLYEEGKNPFIVMLDGITDVGNFGAIARSCCCAGVDALIIPQKGSVSVSADAVKSSAGALLKIPVCKENNLYQCLRYLQKSGLKAVAVTEKGEKNFTQISYKEPIVLILGSEETGISPELLKICDEKVFIPMTSAIASLNVSVATGISLYECVRQRTAVG
ncbi:MAG TPA: 23S rRNA (guanosine(2251)-2'-O)-methyltransferase RlmB [Porphyromonadaceae bacterium]|nr:23S rRNA (guanosine(2251)-2'-O)-methyltransferase RlmB [Porphyromonadaceae bacterium]